VVADVELRVKDQCGPADERADHLARGDPHRQRDRADDERGVAEDVPVAGERHPDQRPHQYYDETDVQDDGRLESRAVAVPSPDDPLENRLDEQLSDQNDCGEADEEPPELNEERPEHG